MATQAEANRVWDRLRRAAGPGEIIRAPHPRGGHDPDPGIGDFLDRQYQDMRPVYNNASRSELLALYETDRNFLKVVLKKTALKLGEEMLTKIRSIHRNVWHRYLTVGSEGERQAEIDKGVTQFARALASWLVFTSDSPYPALMEEIPA